MQPNIPLIGIIETVRTLLAEGGFLARHRAAPRAFTRQRKLPFDCVVLLVLQKTLKSLQLHLQEFFRAARWWRDRTRGHAGRLDAGARQAAPQCLYRAQ